MRADKLLTHINKIDKHFTNNNNKCPSINLKRTQWVPNSEMSNFCSDQGRTRVFGETYVCTSQPETRGERRSGQKWPFMDGH